MTIIFLIKSCHFNVLSVGDAVQNQATSRTGGKAHCGDLIFGYSQWLGLLLTIGEMKLGCVQHRPVGFEVFAFDHVIATVPLFERKQRLAGTVGWQQVCMAT